MNIKHDGVTEFAVNQFADMTPQEFRDQVGSNFHMVVGFFIFLYINKILCYEFMCVLSYFYNLL